MHRAFAFALLTSSLLAAGAAQAQVQAQAQAQAQAQTSGPDGLRGYASPQYAPPQYGATQYGGPQNGAPQYAPPQYGPRPYDDPQYDPRPSSSGLRGYVGVEYGKARFEPGTPSPRVETWTGEGAVSGQLGQFGLQGDIKVANASEEGGGDSSTAWSPTLHAYQRSAYGLIGGWTGWSHVRGGDLFGIGAEGQAYLTGATIYGSVGYGHATTEGTPDQDLWTAYLEGRYFLTENLDLNVHGGLTRSGAPGDRTTIRSIGVGGEYQPGNLPFSIRASYTHADASASTAQSDTMRLGLRWNFDGGTLAQRDRSGPSLNNVTDQFQIN